MSPGVCVSSIITGNNVDVCDMCSIVLCLWRCDVAAGSALTHLAIAGGHCSGTVLYSSRTVLMLLFGSHGRQPQLTRSVVARISLMELLLLCLLLHVVVPLPFGALYEPGLRLQVVLLYTVLQ